MAGLRAALKSLGHQVSCLGTGDSGNPEAGLYSLGGIGPLAHALGYRELKLLRTIERSRGQADLVIVSNAIFLPFARRLDGRTLWFEPHIVERDVWGEQGWIRRLSQGAPLRYAEGAMVRRADKVVCLSRQDAVRFAQLHPECRNRIAVLPHSVDVANWPKRDPGTGHCFVFLGAYSNPANRQSVRFILDEILPRLQPGLRIRLAGDGTPPVNHQDVEVVGRVADIQEAFEGARGCIAPVFLGTGVRTKILEYMAQGLPVISTRQGMEGIAAKEQQHYLAAEDGEEFVNAMLRLGDPVLARRIGAAGRDLIANQHSWTITRETLRDLLVSCEPS